MIARLNKISFTLSLNKMTNHKEIIIYIKAKHEKTNLTTNLEFHPLKKNIILEFQQNFDKPAAKTCRNIRFSSGNTSHFKMLCLY